MKNVYLTGKYWVIVRISSNPEEVWDEDECGNAHMNLHWKTTYELLVFDDSDEMDHEMEVLAEQQDCDWNMETIASGTPNGVDRR